MDDQKRPKDEPLDLFQVEIEEVLGSSEDNGLYADDTIVLRGKLEGAFKLIKPEQAQDTDFQQYWRSLRAFFRNGRRRNDGLPDWEPVTPVVLAPFKDQSYIKSDYPFWVGDVDTWEQVGATRAMPMYQLLAETVSGFAPGEQEARILKENLLRLELKIHEKVRFADTTYLAYPLLVESLDALKTELDVQGKEGEVFAEDLNKLKESLPRKGWIIPFAPKAPLHMLAALLETYRHNRLKAVQAEITQLRARLRELVRLEESKQPGAQAADKLQEDLGFANDLLNFDALSSVLPSGEGEIDEERLSRIKQLIKSLDKANELLLETTAWIIGDESLGNHLGVDWKDDFLHASVKTEKEELCRAAANMFDYQMANLSSVIVAMRKARLEVDGEYIPKVHDPFFTNFTWQGFTEAELANCPPVVLIVDESRLINKEIEAFNRLLSSGRAVKTLVLRSLPEVREGAHSLDLGPLAIAHRHGIVFQGGVVDPRSFWQGCWKGLEAGANALFEVMPASGSELADYLTALAVVESRTMPGLTYDEGKGPRWGSRFDIQNNPSPETDWPVYELIYEEAGTSQDIHTPFSFADFALSRESYQTHFTKVPPSYWSEDLLPLVDYLELESTAQANRIPFVWAVDEEGHLQKIAVSWTMVEACRDRLDYWHYLQENAGIHNYHVELATEQLQAVLEEQWTAEREALEQKQAEEIERVREETARQTMDQLASFLLDMDAELAQIAADVSVPETMPVEEVSEEEPAEPVAKEEAPPEEPEPEEPALPLGEAWIDTPLCTSCGECIDINSTIFKYNAEKQAYIADAKGGNFADIVIAAENCPVRIIHPGAPQHADEPHLDEWIKRAEPFQ